MLMVSLLSFIYFNLIKILTIIKNQDNFKCFLKLKHIHRYTTIHEFKIEIFASVPPADDGCGGNRAKIDIFGCTTV